MQLPAQRLDPGPAIQLLRRAVPEQHPSLEVPDEHRVVGRLQQVGLLADGDQMPLHRLGQQLEARLALAQRLLLHPLLGDVASHRVQQSVLHRHPR